MQTPTSVQKDFINKFTAEILAVIKTRNDVKEAIKRDKERIRKVVEIEKLKKKFAEYLKTAKDEEIKKSEESLVKPEAPKIVENEPRKTEKKPAEIIPSLIKKPVLVAPPPAVKETSLRKELPIQKVEHPREFIKSPQGEIDFGKIVFFVRDPLITYIECPGENKNIIIRKAGRVIRTQITMSKDEIKTLVISFSHKVRIPLVEGVLKARYQNLEISAIVSDVIPSSFILKKDIIPPLEKSKTVLAAPMMSMTPRTPASAQIFPPVRRPFLPIQSAPTLPPVIPLAEAPKEIFQISPTPEIPAAPPTQSQITIEKKLMSEEFTPSIMAKPGEHTENTQAKEVRQKQYKPLPK